MIMRFRALVALVAVLVIGAFACGDAGDELAEQILEQQPGIEDVDVDDGGMSLSVESEDGDVSLQMGSGSDLPDDFPFPIAEGCVVVGSSTWEGPDGMAMQAGIEFPPGDFDSVVAFYEAFLEGEGFEVTRTVTQTETDAMVMLLAVSPEATASVIASRFPGGGSANLMWEPGQA